MPHRSKDVASVYSNEEKQERPWLAYSKDEIFCFCCKFFNGDKNGSHLASKGENIMEIVKKHETRPEHIQSMTRWMKLESSDVQQQEFKSLHQNWLSLEETLKTKKKYGMQIRAPPSKKNLSSSIRIAPPIFGGEDDDDVEREISRQASKTKKLKEIEEQHKKALEEDPNAFAYDEVYDDLKRKEALIRMQDREDRKPRYIQQLMQQAERRKKEQEIVYERKLKKEQAKEEHLFEDKEKFVTPAYRRKLEEQKKWLEEERLRELRDEKDDVTKKKDLLEFYYNIGKNVAFGARDIKAREAERYEVHRKAEKKLEELSKEGRRREEKKTVSQEKKKQMGSVSPKEKGSSIKELPKEASRKRKSTEDAIAAAKERFLARKRAKIEEE